MGPEALGLAEQGRGLFRIVPFCGDGGEHHVARRGGDRQVPFRVDAVAEPARVRRAGRGRSASVAAATAASFRPWSRWSTAMPVRASKRTARVAHASSALERALDSRLGAPDLALVQQGPTETGEQ